MPSLYVTWLFGHAGHGHVCAFIPRPAVPLLLPFYLLQEFTAEMRSMLLGAHEALISSNAWLVERLKTVEVRFYP